MLSLPSRERGLKLTLERIEKIYGVAPFAGARIEILHHLHGIIIPRVAPFAGARIEIQDRQSALLTTQSLPSRERGLKSQN